MSASYQRIYIPSTTSRCEVTLNEARFGKEGECAARSNHKKTEGNGNEMEDKCNQAKSP